jgi:acetyl-CoA synthetase
MHHHTGRHALDLHAGEVYWCTADPGWVTGTSEGILAPLMRGVTMIVDEADLDVERWYDLLQDERVRVWYTAPTAIRMLMRAGAEPARRRDLSRLRFLASVGEPLNPEAVLWSREVFGRAFHDNWWQTQTGGITVANYPSMPIRPGSMGKPLPGVEAAIVRRVTELAGPGEGAPTVERVVPVEEPDVEGEPALRPGWPSMMRAYDARPRLHALPPSHRGAAREDRRRRARGRLPAPRLARRRRRLPRAAPRRRLPRAAPRRRAGRRVNHQIVNVIG